jgi:hypothetical protein
MKTQEPTVPGYGRSETQGNVTREGSYATTGTSAQIDDRWMQIQSEFVDDPRKAVTDAQQLVSGLMQRIIDSFSEERDQLERQWAGGNGATTEELRMCLQHYRDLFSRLMPTAGEARSTH